MSSRGHVHDADYQWMAWLKKCSKMEGTSGACLYREYNDDEQAWLASTYKLRSEQACRWSFCRGSSSMSSADIASARHRYLDRYPLTAEEKCSARYVDALLEIDACQIRVRQCPGSACPGCTEKDRTIASLRAALSDGDILQPEIVDNKVIRSIFHRHFILDGTSGTSRTEVRETIEQAMRQELGPEVSLPSSSPLWSTFMRNTLGTSGTSGGPIRCLRRLHPLTLPAAD